MIIDRQRSLVLAAGGGVIAATGLTWLFTRRGKKSSLSIVVLGGGFAGCHVADAMQDEADVTLIDTGAGFSNVTAQHEALCGRRSPESNHRDLAQLLPRANVLVVNSEPKVNVEDKEVMLRSGERVSFDYLVIATGSSYSSAIKCAADGSSTAAEHQQQTRKHTQGLRDALHVMVIGGGIVGTELSSELAAMFRSLTVTFVTGRAGLLPECPPWGRSRALRWFMRQKNVTLLQGQRCTQGSDGLFVLEDGTRLPKADMVFTCTGVMPNTSFLRGPSELLPFSPAGVCPLPPSFILLFYPSS